ncbi:MAG: methyltransferase domain-containing protein [Beijerinckiaceae bacterium]|nr:methyltransferase domain-containing protein [Beijerinckiaceae bacterium]
MTRSMYVQYGCGLAAPDGWVNFDSSPRLRFERMPGVGAVAALLGKRLFPENIDYGDIVQGLPVPDGGADAVYASHVLEHLSRNDVSVALANTYRVLRPGGVFRLIVPDLHWRAALYLADRANGDAAAAERFIASTHMGLMDRPQGLMGILRGAYGSTGHRWFYDEASMRTLLAEAGFVDVRLCAMGDSGDPMFDRVEDIGRFVFEGEAELAMEARRPNG